MAAIYGASRWDNHAPLTVMEDWAAILEDRTMADIARGIERCEQASDTTFPPGAAEFKRRCLEYQPGTFAGGKPRPLPPLPKLLEGATVSGDARAYLDMIRRVTAGERLRREELAGLPPCFLPGGDMIKPVDYCTAKEDETL